ncbi:MAG: gamma-glutamylcyclotransferase [Rubrivivax sp.]|nr:gamma-glutamylcyclotransferase [Rubrivivax sp.]
MPTAPATRRVQAFFYGLFMDEAVLRQSGVVPGNPRRARVADFALRIGQRATLVPMAGAQAFGMVMSLTHAELNALYGAPGLELYRPEAVLVQTLEDGLSVPALCYNLREPPEAGERNPEYAKRLRAVLSKLGFPVEYVESIQ